MILHMYMYIYIYMIARFPIINNLIGKISRKKRRNTLILATVTAVCLFLLIIWLFR